MVPVSHAVDLKASNSKVSPNQAQQAPAKTGFQALLERLARPLHAEPGEKPVKASAEKPKAEAHLERKPEKLAAVTEKAEKLEKPEKTPAQNDRPDAGLVLAALVLKPEPLKTAEAAAQTAAASLKTVRERGTETKPQVGADLAPPTAGPRPAFRHSEQTADEKPKVFVADRRTEKDKEKDKLRSDMAAAQPQGQTPAPAPEAAAKADAVTGVAETKVAFHPTDQGTPFDIKPQPQNAPVAPRDAAAFQQYLVDKGYGQLVEQARIVLKDNNAGEIRMTLHPESLGKVKVALNLSDGSLAGQIFVENQTVKDVFQANLDGLLQAFRDGGWSDLSLQVSVGGEQKRQNADSAPVPAKSYGRQVAGVSAETPETIRIGAWTDRQINLTA